MSGCHSTVKQHDIWNNFATRREVELGKSATGTGKAGVTERRLTCALHWLRTRRMFYRFHVFPLSGLTIAGSIHPLSRVAKLARLQRRFQYCSSSCFRLCKYFHMCNGFSIELSLSTLLVSFILVFNIVAVLDIDV
jgi:hypothetical protein